MKKLLALSLFISLCFISCNNAEDPQIEIIEEQCTEDREVNTSRGACDETLGFTQEFSMTIANDTRIIETNNIPDHDVGLFGMGRGSLNPNAIAPLDLRYEMDATPAENSEFTSLMRDTGGIAYSFGVLLNGIELDPVAAEPWPHSALRGQDPNANWDWNLEALNALLGLDCNNAHVQNTGQYHHHGAPTLYLESISAGSDTMTLIGFAADGFPIYYKYAYSNANDANSTVTAMSSSYRLKTGERPGDGITAPCGEYSGVYSNDYEYVDGLGTLDEANGRNGVTPEFPSGTYYYVITDEFPSIPRYFRGTPSDDFTIGR